ncbi:MAG: TolC family protein [Candidatus Omnitrophota bacterium]
MRINRIILLYLVVIIAVVLNSPHFLFSAGISNQDITQYIVDISKEIYRSIQKSDQIVLDDSKGEVKIKLLLSPWGELKDVSISESSGSRELDNVCLKAAWLNERYQPFPEALGDEELWIDVPLIFGAMPESEGSFKTDSWKAGDNTATRVEKLGLPKRDFSLAAESAGKKERIRTSLGLNEAVDAALENQMSTKIALEEIELSKLKIREARRALYPAASLNYLETIGKTTGVTQDFTDKEYKVKFEYPLYYGWRLKYAVDQAVTNMKASQAFYDKALQDLRVEVETAFYSYVASKMNEKIHKALLEDLRGIFDNAKKKFELGLSTKAEFMQSENQMKQINYQIVSSENELAMAKLALMQAMNAGDDEGALEAIKIDTAGDLEPINLDIAMEDCVGLAFKSRPDLRHKEYMVEFNDYERKINQSKNQLKVDLTGTYGKSGGAYESEGLTMGRDWYLGFKVTKPLGGNTISTAYTQDKTSQKHGQSTRTESSSQSVEMGLLDNLQSFSERKSSEIALKKAQDELQQTKDGILKEVKESYLNYKKGVVQMNTNLDKVRYREEELKIAKARAGLNDIPVSELIQAHMNLADEKSYYIEALGSVYQALTKLNKATGYTLFVDDESFRLADIKGR